MVDSFSCTGQHLQQVQTLSASPWQRRVFEFQALRASSVCLDSLLSGLGLVMRQLPRAEVSLGDARKETEPATFAGESMFGQLSPASRALEASEFQELLRPACDACGTLGSKRKVRSNNSSEPESPWRFGDTLVFSAGREDLKGPGVRFRLVAHSDVRVGPLQMDLLKSSDLGGCRLDLRKQVLPLCQPIKIPPAASNTVVDSFSQAAVNQQLWETPVQVLNLMDADGAETGARLAVIFCVNSEPRALLHLGEGSETPLADILAGPLRLLVQQESALSSGPIQDSVWSKAGSSQATAHPQREALPPTRHRQEEPSPEPDIEGSQGYVAAVADDKPRGWQP